MTAMFKWPQPKVGATRCVSLFLLIPRCLGGEWRWLGYERINQERIYSFKHACDWWVDREWAE